MKKDFSRKRIKVKKILKILLSIFTFVLIIDSFYKFDNILRKVVQENTDIMAKITATKAIDNAINSVIREHKITSEDFLFKNFDLSGQLTAISANTVEINDICSNIALQIGNELSQSDIQQVQIPIGTLTGINVFMNRGYKISVDVLQSGSAEVNYNTEFYSAGINQVNFQVWLNVDVTVNIITPLENRRVLLSRKVTIVDTVIRGNIPESYISTTDENAIEVIPRLGIK